jgi:electron-transferring-flavoprotein dehydrogenase
MCGGFADFFPLQVLHDENNNVIGVATNDMGISKSGEIKDSFARGLELRAKQTILGEGCRGSLTKTLFAKHKLRANCQHQTFGLGVKELWEVDPSKHHEGSIIHSIGYPVDTATWGGSFMYHMKDNKVALGYVVGLDYENTYLSPYQELQRLKHHPLFASVLDGGKCISYGARTLNEGGLQSIPKLTFPGGVLVGCTAGFLNVPKVKGTHTAMKSGMLAAESIYEAVVNEATSAPVEVKAYEDALKSSWVYEELHGVRNIRPSFKWGLLPFLAYSALDTYILRGKAPWTIQVRLYRCAM